jgi:pimeloyl-ACP methyl ester carboxylesterase
MTNPVSGPRARAAAPRVDEGLFADLGGVPQWMTLRGRDPESPPLLLIGGPGAAFSPMAPLFAPWEERFTLVQWDQPGSGATFQKNGDLAPMSFGRLAADGVAAAEAALRRLGKPKLALMATSGGTIVALEMVRRWPDLFSAYVGNGQVVHWAEQEAASYAMVLAQARTAGNAEAVAELEALGPPPWKTTAQVAVKSKYANAMTPKEQAFFAAEGAAAMTPPPAGARYDPPQRPTHDVRAQSMRVFDALKDEMFAYDARARGVRFEVPMVILQGALDAHITTPQVVAWFDEIEAPVKALELIDGAGHMSIFLTRELAPLLARHVLPLAR